MEQIDDKEIKDEEQNEDIKSDETLVELTAARELIAEQANKMAELQKQIEETKIANQKLLMQASIAIKPKLTTEELLNKMF